MRAKKSVGQLADSGTLVFGDGYRTKRPEHAADGYRIIRVADVDDGEVHLSGPDFVSADYAKAIGPKAGKPGDVLLTTKGTIGRVAVLPETDELVVYSPQLCYFRVNANDRLDSRYLRYWFKSPEFVNQASHRMNNTDMAAYINLADIRSLEMSLPGMNEQQAIAQVLGALDDKIAANTTLASTSDTLASSLFDSALKAAESSETRFADVAKVSGGGTPSTKVSDYWDGGIAWATPTDLTSLSGPYLDSTSRTITKAGLDACSSALFPVGTVLMTSRATIGSFAIAEIPTAVNQGFIVVEPNDDELRYWILHEMRSRVDEFIAWANGATFLELSRGTFKKLKVRLAPADVMRGFNSEARCLHERARTALQENRTLAATRDALLPQLMSGKLRVRDAEKIVEEVV